MNTCHPGLMMPQPNGGAMHASDAQSSRRPMPANENNMWWQGPQQSVNFMARVGNLMTANEHLKRESANRLHNMNTADQQYRLAIQAQQLQQQQSI